MQDLTDLILDLLEFVKDEPKSYAEVMDAWRTSCPRLTVWEDAVDAGYVARKVDGAATAVVLTEKGRSHLANQRPEAT